MTYKQIEQAREIRLWIGQIIIPAMGIGAMINANPETMNNLKSKAINVKNGFMNFINKPKTTK